VGIFGASHQSAETVRAQVLSIIEDFHIACAKTGMLPTREVIREVARLFRETDLPAPVIDPVVRSTSGYELIDDAALTSLIAELMPLARLITPNIPEAELITKARITDEDGMHRAARALRERGARAVLIKGGHLEGATALDLLLDEDGRVTLFREERIETNATHGTGCTLSAAIAASLGRGMTLKDSVATAKRFVTDAIRHAPRIGRGSRPINHNVPVHFKTREGS
jgi:hydroxymethylpyrimidine kinase/phosphomethylpyrimidine kinase